MNLVTKSIGLLLVVSAFLPLKLMFGELRGTQWLLGPAQWLLSLFILTTLSVILALFIPKNVFERVKLFLLKQHPSLLVSISFLSSFVSLVFISKHIFHTKPVLIDGIVQSFQAKIFSVGSLWSELPASAAFFIPQNMLLSNQEMTSQYPPLHSLILMLGELVSMQWVVPIVLTFGAIFLIYHACTLMYDKKTAYLCLLLSCICPFLLFIGASYMNHVSTLFFLSLMLVALVYWERGASKWSTLVLGFGFGAAVSIRPLTGLALGGSLLIPACLGAIKKRAYLDLLVGLSAASVPVFVFLLTNYVITGDFLSTGYTALWGADHGLGFHLTPWGEQYGPLDGIRDQLIDMWILNQYLFESLIPALLPIGLFLLLSKQINRWDRQLAFSFFSLSFAYLFYWHRDALLGPRFLFEAVLVLLPLTARSLLWLWSALKDTQVKFIRRIDVQSILMLMFFFSCSYQFCVSYVDRAVIYKENFKFFGTSLIEEVKEKNIEDAIIFIPTSFGARLIAHMQAAGFNASFTEKTYRSVDHCQLYQKIKEYLDGELDQKALKRNLIALSEQKVALVRSARTKDKTLRLTQGKVLSDECASELEYDNQGYSMYEPSLLDNDPMFDGRIIYARDMHDFNTELMQAYPQKSAYLYRDGRFVSLTR